jgi:hypothetical protein
MPARTATPRKTFTAKLEGDGTTGAWCHAYLPGPVSSFLGKRGNVPIVLTVRGCDFRVTARPDGAGRHYVVFNSRMREEAEVALGEVLRCTVALDTAPREAVAPPDLVRALRADVAARSAFEAMPPAHRRAHVQFVEEASRAETRTRRIEQSLALMREWGAQRRSRSAKRPKE